MGYAMQPDKNRKTAQQAKQARAWDHDEEPDDTPWDDDPETQRTPESRRGLYYCMNCESIVKAYKRARGSFFLEVLLWLLFLLPGILYSAWRSNSKRRTCPKCGSTEVIPADSPRATRLIDGR